MSARRISPETVLIAALAGAVALPSLVDAWRHSPCDRAGSAAFLVWVISGVLLFRQGPTDRRPARWMPGVALTLLATGTLTDMNALRHAALATALTAFLSGPRHFLWLAAALAWMPLLGWLLPVTPAVAAALRLTLAALPFTLLFPIRRSARALTIPPA